MADEIYQSFQLPQALNWLNESENGREWLSLLPARIENCAKKWELRLLAPYQQSYVSIVFPARLPDASGCVLKIQYPHPESENEAEALRLWNGRGAVRLFDYDSANHALLMEQCEPGDHLSSICQQQALEVFAELLPSLWIGADEPFRKLEDESAAWLIQLPLGWERAGQPFELPLLEAGLEAINRLRTTQGERVLLHQDLHGDNVLRALRQPWLAIDPKPLAGERELSLAPIIRGYEFGHSRDEVVHRLDWLSSALRLDRERARLWALAQTLAWSFDGGRVYDKHVETARWLWQA